MSYTNDWVDTTPIDHTKFKNAPGAIRQVRVDVEERLMNMFYGWISGEVSADEGVKNLPFRYQAADPGATANKIKVYSKQVTGKTELFMQDEDGHVIQLTAGGILNAVNLTGDQTVAGIKTLSSIPILPASNPTTDNQAVRKAYVDATQKINQVLNSKTAAAATCTPTFTVTDAIPTISFGTQILSLSITPANTNNLLRIEVTLQGSTTGADNVTVGIFQDATSNAIASKVVSLYNGANPSFFSITLDFYMIAGTTSSTTFTVRMAAQAAACYLNGNSGGRVLGGTGYSSITVTEVKA